MSRSWTTEQREAHAARLKDLFNDPAYKECKRQKALLRAATAPYGSIIPPSVYDRRLDLGPDDDLDIVTIVWPPEFDLTLVPAP